jgi:hypothetical protein
LPARSINNASIHASVFRLIHSRSFELHLQEYSVLKRITGATVLLLGVALTATAASAATGTALTKKAARADVSLANAAASAERGMWLWNDSDIGTTAKQNQVLNFAVQKKVTTIYLHSEGLLKNTPQLLAKFIAAAASRNVGVELLFGAPEWAFTQNHQIALSLMAKANAFVNSLPGAKPRGVHFDVEPHALPGWQANQTSYGNQLLDLYAKLQKAKLPGLYLNADIAMGYSVVNITRNGKTKPLSYWLVDAVDRTTVMTYRDYAQGPDSIIYHGNGPVNYAASVGKRSHIGVETTCNLEPEKITFCEEGNANMEAALGSVVANYRANTGFGGVAIHDYRAYLILK